MSLRLRSDWYFRVGLRASRLCASKRVIKRRVYPRSKRTRWRLAELQGSNVNVVISSLGGSCVRVGTRSARWFDDVTIFRQVISSPVGFSRAEPRLEPVTTRRRCLPRHGRGAGNDPPRPVCTCSRGTLTESCTGKLTTRLYIYRPARTSATLWMQQEFNGPRESNGARWGAAGIGGILGWKQLRRALGNS